MTPCEKQVLIHVCLEAILRVMSDPCHRDHAAMIYRGHRPLYDYYLWFLEEMKKGDDAVVEFHARRAAGEWFSSLVDISDALVDEPTLKDLGILSHMHSDEFGKGFESQDEHVHMMNICSVFTKYVLASMHHWSWRGLRYSTCLPHLMAHQLHPDTSLATLGQSKVRVLATSIIQAEKIVLNREGSYWPVILQCLENMPFTREPLIREALTELHLSKYELDGVHNLRGMFRNWFCKVTHDRDNMETMFNEVKQVQP